MLFSYKWLESLIEGKIPKPQKLAELLTMHSFEVEEIEKRGQDFVLDIAVLPDRGSDCLSHLGIAREISAILRKKLKELKREKLKTIKGKIKPIKLKIGCPRLVSRYSAIVLENVKIASSPRWLRERLKSLGLRSVNNVVDLTNFIMLETGQPLHAFDYDKIKGQKITVRLSKKGEKLITLDDKKHTLDKDILVIEDQNRLIDLVGIMGGKNSEVDFKTKNIVLQAGNFDRWTIYQGIKKLNFSTQAANIYIHGFDPNLSILALERIHYLFKKLSQGQIVQIIDVYPKKVKPSKIKLDLKHVENLLGIKISANEIKNILTHLHFNVTRKSKVILEVKVPTWRLDISIPEDLIEEIGRISGLQKISSLFPTVALIPPQKNLNIFWENLNKDILKEAGFSEVYNSSFINKKEAEISNFKLTKLIEVKNPTSLDYQYLRPSLIPKLLINARDNLKNFQDIRIFELGKVFKEKSGSRRNSISSKTLGYRSGGRKDKSLAGEKRMLSGLISGDSFYELKGVIDLFLEKLGIVDAYYDNFQPTPETSEMMIWNLQKCAEIKIGNSEVGFLGEIKSDILRKLKIKEKIIVFDLDFEKLQKLADEQHEYRPISQYPAAIRDIALLVPREVRVADVLNVIERVGGETIIDVDLFDIYEGEELPMGKKNLAFHLIYQAENKTLSSKEIDAIQKKIIKALEKNREWEVRR